MKFLSQVLPQSRQAVRSGTWFGPTIAGCFLGLEIFGRFSRTDVQDVLGIIVLMALTILVLERHRVKALNWVAAAGRSIERVFSVTEALKFEMGIDFRGSPAIPRRTPPILVLLPLFMASVTALGFAGWLLYPQGWRQPLSQFFYVGYLVGLLVLWGALGLCALVGGFFLPIMLLDRLVPSHRGSNPRLNRKHVFFVGLYVLVMGLGQIYLPYWVIPAFCLVTLCLVAIAIQIPTASGVQFIWRRNPTGPVWSITSRKMLLYAAATIVLSLTAMISVSTGNRVLGLPDQDCTMPVTTVLGAMLAALVPGILLSGTALLWIMWKHNPSRPCKPVIHIADAKPENQPEIHRILRRWGWTVHFAPRPASATDVKIRLVSTRHSEAREYQVTWPLAVSMADLRDGSVRDRFDRRDELIKRRCFLKGLKKLFRSAAARRHPGGSGYWLAPHQWLLQGMLRDDMQENEGDDASFLTRPVGPPYEHLFDRSVRHYLYVLMTSLQIDLIFVEDGIGYRKLNRVMRTMFEVYDKSAGQKRAEEVQFLGLPRVKVMIHEFLLDKPFTSELYPEPRFENLGRARIMHVFRDRGDQEELAETPFDFSFEPEPMFV